MIVDWVFIAHQRSKMDYSFRETDRLMTELTNRDRGWLPSPTTGELLPPASDEETVWEAPLFLDKMFYSLFGLQLICRDAEYAYTPGQRVGDVVHWLILPSSAEEHVFGEVVCSMEALNSVPLKSLKEWIGMSRRFEVFGRLMGWQKKEPQLFILNVFEAN